MLETYPGPLLVPTLVITEVDYLLSTRLGINAEVRFLGDLAARNLIAVPVAAGDWLRVAELVHRYRDLGISAADASVVAAADRLGIVDVATTDRRRFTVVRPRHAESFNLLP